MSEELATTIERLHHAGEAYASAVAAVDAIDGAKATTVPELLRRFESILRAYQDRATGSGDFRGYLEFRREVDTFVADLPEDLAARDAFEAAGERLDERRLLERHFDAAREALEPAREIAATLENRTTAAAELRAARDAAIRHRDALDARIDRLDQLLQYRGIDVDASVAPIRDPIVTYNQAVREAFGVFRRERPAGEVLALFDLADRYPLVGMTAPPAALLGQVQTGDFATLTIPELLEFADFSRSKLAHYIDDPTTFREAIAEHRRYLERRDATPFEIDWPPPPADHLRWRGRELVSVVDRFADEDAVVALRNVLSSVRDNSSYTELRRVALARADLGPDERRRLASGDLAAERADRQADRERLDAVLDDVPVPEAV